MACHTSLSFPSNSDRGSTIRRRLFRIRLVENQHLSQEIPDSSAFFIIFGKDMLS